MGVETRNLVLGPARVYYGPAGTAEPADSTVADDGWLVPPPSPWRDLGGTDGGVTVEIDSTLTPKQVDQMIMEPGAWLTALKMSVTTPLAEITDENFAVALNNITESGSGEGFVTLEIPDGTEVTQLGYSALIVDGWGPALPSGAPTLRRCIVRKVLSTAKVALTADKKTQQKLDCTWSVYAVGGGIRPIHFATATA